MPNTIQLENEDCGVIVTFEGHVTGEEVLQVNYEVYSHKMMHRFRYQLWDFLGADRVKVSNTELREMAMQDYMAAQKNPQQIIAIVGTRAFFRGAHRRYMIYAQSWPGYETRSFLVEEDARKWITEQYPNLFDK